MVNKVQAVIEVTECFDCPFHKRSIMGLPICRKRNQVLPHGPLPTYYAGFRGAFWIPRILERGRPSWCPLILKDDYIQKNVEPKYNEQQPTS